MREEISGPSHLERAFSKKEQFSALQRTGTLHSKRYAYAFYIEGTHIHTYTYTFFKQNLS